MGGVSKISAGLIALLFTGQATAGSPRDQRIAVRLSQLSKALGCAPGPAAPKGLCIGAEGFARGTAGEIPEGQRVFLGLTYPLVADSPSTAKAGQPRLTELLLQRVGSKTSLWLADITPDNDAESQQMSVVMSSIGTSLAGKPATLAFPPDFAKLLQGTISVVRQHPLLLRPLQQLGVSWTMEGQPHELRRVGANWVLVGVGPDGVLLTLFSDANPFAP